MLAMATAGDRCCQGLNLDLPAGSFHFLTGPSGSGKTTILKLCYLDLRPDEGQITLFDQDAASLDRDNIAALRRRIGVVHQNCEFSRPPDIAGEHCVASDRNGQRNALVRERFE